MRYIFQENVTDGFGNAISGASITVYLAGTSTKATIYTAVSGGSADADSVIASDSAGYFKFFVDEDDYPHSQKFKISVSYSGYTADSWGDYLQLFPDSYRTLITDSTIDQGDNSIIGTLAWHISNASGAATTVTVLTGTHKITTNITVPITMNLKFEKGGIIKPDSAKSLTVYSPRHIIALESQQIIDTTNNSTNPLLFTSAGGGATAEWWGAVGNGTTNDFTALNCLFTSGAKECFLLAKTYVATGAGFTLSTNRTIIRGQGLDSRINFNPSAADKDLFYSNASLDNLIFENFYVVNTNTDTYADISAFYFTANVTAVIWRDVYIYGFNRYGIHRASGKYDRIERCRFWDMDNSVEADYSAIAIRYTTYANDVTITESRFSENDKCIRIEDGSSNGVRITNNVFEGNGNSGNAFGFSHVIDLTDVHGVYIAGNYFEGNVTDSPYADIGLEDCQAVVIEGNFFEGQLATVDKTQRFIGADADTHGVSVKYNYFAEPIEYFIASTNTIKTEGNYYKDGASRLTAYADIAALMSGKVQIDVDYTFTWDPGNLVDGAGATSVEQTVAGAAFGDYVRVSAPYSLQGIIATAYVSDTGKCSVRLQNETTGAIDLASGTWRLRVIKE